MIFFRFGFKKFQENFQNFYIVVLQRATLNFISKPVVVKNTLWSIGFSNFRQSFKYKYLNKVPELILILVLLLVHPYRRTFSVQTL